MSEGPRYPTDRVTHIAAHLCGLWFRDAGVEDCMIVGGIRRQSETVGDIDLIVAMPTPNPAGEIGWDEDPVFRKINGSLKQPLVRPVPVVEAAPEADLFELTRQMSPLAPAHQLGKLPASQRASAQAPAVDPDRHPKAFAEGVRGVKPGFITASVVVKPFAGSLAGREIPVQVERFTPENRGWKIIMRTGPSDFGQWFLGKWKARYGIPFGPAGKASINGHLVDRHGAVVPVRSEEEAFDLCKQKYVPPHLRHFASEQ